MIYRKTCEWCGKEFTAQKSSTRFCSRQCTDHAYKQKLHSITLETMGIHDEQTRRKIISSNEVMTPTLLSKYLGVSRSTAYRYIESGFVKSVQVRGRTFVRKVDVDKVFEESLNYQKYSSPFLHQSPNSGSQKIEASESSSGYTTVKEVAEKYSLSLAGTDRILKDSGITVVKHKGKHYYPVSEVEALFRKREAASHPEISEWYTGADVCTIPMDTVMKTVRTDPPSDFLTFLLSILDAGTVYHAAIEYSLGVTKSRDVIFYQIDVKGRCRTGKVMKYDPVTGHRIKGDGAGTPITWVHSLLKRNGTLAQGWELSQCLFGEHLLARYPDKPVALMESEKTAVVCACINPDCVWLATGGKGQLNDRVEVLAGRKVIAFPDVDGYDTWVQKAAERPHLGIIVSDLLEKNATPEDRAAHIDIADLLIRWMQARQEHHAEMLALIEELDLKVVGVT